MTNYPLSRQDDTEITAWNAAANMTGSLGTGNVPFAATRRAAWREFAENGYQLAYYRHGGLGISEGSGRNI